MLWEEAVCLVAELGQAEWRTCREKVAETVEMLCICMYYSEALDMRYGMLSYILHLAYGGFDMI